MTGTLVLKGISIQVILGVLPKEKLFPRRVTLDLEFSGTHSSPPAVDYSEVCSLVSAVSHQGFDYIEELAGRVFQLLGARWPGEWKVTVKKPFPPVDSITESADYTIEG